MFEEKNREHETLESSKNPRKFLCLKYSLTHKQYIFKYINIQKLCIEEQQVSSVKSGWIFLKANNLFYWRNLFIPQFHWCTWYCRLFYWLMFLVTFFTNHVLFFTSNSDFNFSLRDMRWRYLAQFSVYSKKQAVYLRH